MAASKTSGADLRELSFDEVQNLHQQLEVVIRYRTGGAYRPEFDSAVSQLKPFGFSFDEEKATREADKIRTDTMQAEAGQLENSDNKE